MGDVFGESDAILGEPRDGMAIAAKPCTLLSIPTEDFMKLMQ